MDLSSIIALKATLIFVALLCLREKDSDISHHKVAAWILGILFLVAGTFAFTDVQSEEPEVRMCSLYILTKEIHCMPPTTHQGCIDTLRWFEHDADWHNKNRYCCVQADEQPETCFLIKERVKELTGEKQ